MIKRLFISLAVALVVLACIAFLGGIHYYSYSEFVPSSGKSQVHKEGFRPDIYPFFTQGGSDGLKCIFPYLFYRESTTDRNPSVVVSTHDTFDRYGYAGKSTIVFETVNAKNETDEIFQIVSDQRAVKLSLLGLGSGSGTEHLGAIKGKKIIIQPKVIQSIKMGNMKNLLMSRHGLSLIRRD